MTANMIQSGMGWLGAQMKDFATQAVTYKRASLSLSLSIQATVGPSSRILDNGDTIISHQDLEFAVTATDLKNGSTQLFPQPADRIVVTINGLSYQYEVLTNEGDEAWSWTDSSKTRFLINTKAEGIPT